MPEGIINWNATHLISYIFTQSRAFNENLGNRAGSHRTSEQSCCYVLNYLLFLNKSVPHNKHCFPPWQKRVPPIELLYFGQPVVSFWLASFLVYDLRLLFLLLMSLISDSGPPCNNKGLESGVGYICGHSFISSRSLNHQGLQRLCRRAPNISDPAPFQMLCSMHAAGKGRQECCPHSMFTLWIPFMQITNEGGPLCCSLWYFFLNKKLFKMSLSRAVMSLKLFYFFPTLLCVVRQFQTVCLMPLLQISLKY